jgi:FdhD protein
MTPLAGRTRGVIPPTPDRPAPDEGARLVPVATRLGGKHDDADDSDTVAVEEPLEIRIEGRPVAITMRTPGHDLDLAAGFLWTEGVVEGGDDLRALACVADNVVDAVLAEGVPAARLRAADRALYATSSCGICGKASLDRLRVPEGRVTAPDLSPDGVLALAAALRGYQPLFDVTGGVHGALLAEADGTVIVAREDVGRHNAVDKVLGACLRADLDVEGRVLVVSSRAGFEIVQKAAACGIGALVAVGAPTSLAVEAAGHVGLALGGWVRADRATRYT